MKKITLCLMASLWLTALVSCHRCEELGEKVQVTVSVDDFEIFDEPFSGSKNTNTVKNISFAIFKANGEVEYSANQTETDADFGTFSYPLYQGQYTIVAVGHKNSAGHAVIQSPSLVTFPNNAVTDIFAKVQTINITNNSPQTIDLALDRAISCLKVSPTDTIPSTVSSITFNYSSGGYTLNPATLLCPSVTGVQATIDVPATAHRTSQIFSRYVILNAEEQTMNITVTAYDGSDNVIVSRTFNNVTLKRNRQTIARGAFFSSTGTSTLTFNDDYLTNDTITF